MGWLLHRLRPAWRELTRPVLRRRRIALALQGGGAFGAFTWGVLDRLLDDETIEIETISAASAGAVNAVVMAMGLANGGRLGAKSALERFWSRISRRGLGSQGALAFGAAAGVAFDLSSRVLSPYQTNPFDLNPLRDLLAAEIDFAQLRAAPPLRLLIAATHVGEGCAQIFRESEISLDVVLASSCLPLLHRAVQIDGESYWDGGFTANPPLLPLLTSSKARDVLIVQISPLHDSEPPRTAPRIVRRAAQIGFGSPLQGELQALAALAPLYRGPGAMLSPLARRLNRLRLHRLAAEDEIEDLAHLDPLDLDWSFLQRLCDGGRKSASAWLERQGGAVDKTPDLRTTGHRNVTDEQLAGH